MLAEGRGIIAGRERDMAALPSVGMPGWVASEVMQPLHFSVFKN